MKILFDHQMFSIQKYGGISRYFCEIIKHLPPEVSFKLSVLFSQNHHLKENYEVFKKINLLPEKNFKGKYFIQKKINWLNGAYSQYCIKKNHFDLFHPTFYDNYFLKILKKPYIITVHDLIAFKFDDPFYNRFQRKLQMENAIKKANRVIAISENTKNDLIDILHIHPDKIDVVHHGFIKTNSYKENNHLGKYILFVGQRSHHKNFKTLVKTASMLFNKEKDITLVCVGKPFDEEETNLLSQFKIANKVIVMNVDDSTLNNLYANALAFVYPSLYEGFGMPILEAFANHCPVCLSNTSCFPEVAANAAVYFDPNSPDSILSAIEKIIFDKKFANEITMAGAQRLSNFSWQKAASQTALAYKKIIE